MWQLLHQQQATGMNVAGHLCLSSLCPPAARNRRKQMRSYMLSLLLLAYRIGALQRRLCLSPAAVRFVLLLKERRKLHLCTAAQQALTKVSMAVLWAALPLL